jgi:hypothetical protein
MSSRECCTTQEQDGDYIVKVTVEVSKIIKYLSIAAVLIVGIIFGTVTFRKMMENGFFNEID